VTFVRYLKTDVVILNLGVRECRILFYLNLHVLHKHTLALKRMHNLQKVGLVSTHQHDATSTHCKMTPSLNLVSVAN
jgi:hypothetical protein